MNRHPIKDPQKTRYDGQDSDEKVEYVFRASGLTLIPKYFLVAIMTYLPTIAVPFLSSLKVGDVQILGSGIILAFAIFWYLATCGIAFQIFLGWYFNIFFITNKKVVDIDFIGLLYKNVSETTISNIEDVTSTVKGALGIIFNIGNVVIQTAGEKREFEFDNVDDPSGIRDLISDIVSKKKGHGLNGGNN